MDIEANLITSVPREGTPSKRGILLPRKRDDLFYKHRYHARARARAAPPARTSRLQQQLVPGVAIMMEESTGKGQRETKRQDSGGCSVVCVCGRHKGVSDTRISMAVKRVHFFHDQLLLTSPSRPTLLCLLHKRMAEEPPPSDRFVSL